MLDKKEAENEIPNGEMEEQDDKKEKKKKKKKKIEEEHVDEIIKEVRDSTGKNIGFEEEEEYAFWMPPDGHRWDHDDGGDRWGSDSESGPETDGDDEEDAGEEDEDVMGTEEATHETAEISKRTKRMSLEIGPSSFATRKKKKKTEATA